MSGTTPAPKAYILGAELREARTRAGLTTTALAHKLGYKTHTVILRWESGERVPDEQRVTAFLSHVGASMTEIDRIVAMVSEAKAEPVNSVSVGASGERNQLVALLEFERVATRITDVSPMLVPGLLQSPDYVRAIMRRLPSHEIEARAAMRLGRRDVITRSKSPAQYTALIGEHVLHQAIGGEAVLVDQLNLILKLAELANVHVRIIPTAAGFTPAHVGPFVLLEFAHAKPVVHLEHHRSSVFLRDEGDVSAYLSAREDIESEAMSPTESLGLIADVVSNRTEQ